MSPVDIELALNFQGLSRIPRNQPFFYLHTHERYTHIHDLLPCLPQIFPQDTQSLALSPSPDPFRPQQTDSNE